MRIEDFIPKSIPYVRGIYIEGGFLDQSGIQFSKNLNCIIGGRGAGKSTIFESIRCALGIGTKSQLLDSEVWPDKINLIWNEKSGEQYYVAREKYGDSVNISHLEMGVLAFPIECYGQGETAQTSQKAESDPYSLLNYLDQFINFGTLFEEEINVRSMLLKNQSAIEEVNIKIAQIPEYQKLLIATKKQLDELEKAKASEIVALERKIAEERGIRNDLKKYIANIKELTQNSPLTDSLSLIKLRTKIEDLKVGQNQFRSIVEFSSDLEAKINISEQERNNVVAKYTEQVESQLRAWDYEEKEISDNIEKIKQDLVQKGIRVDMPYIRKLTQDEARYSKTLAELEHLKKNQYKSLMIERIKLRKERWEIRNRISALRDAYAKKISKGLEEILTDLSVSIKFCTDALSQDAEEIIQSAMNWRTSQVPRAKILVNRLRIPELLNIIKRKEVNPICELRKADNEKIFSKADAEELIYNLSSPQIIYKLERCHIEDLPKITVTKKVVDTDGKLHIAHRDFSRLSLGQQQSILLTLMLFSDNEKPLIIDQPEDNLDSEFIYHTLVAVLRKVKERRQVIIVTHNANIAVLGDAEQIVALKSLSDKAKIVKSGSIDDEEMKVVACQILEGTEEAFTKRARIYSLPRNKRD